MLRTGAIAAVLALCLAAVATGAGAQGAVGSSLRSGVGHPERHANGKAL